MHYLQKISELFCVKAPLEGLEAFDVLFFFCFSMMLLRYGCSNLIFTI